MWHDSFILPVEITSTLQTAPLHSHQDRPDFHRSYLQAPTAQAGPYLALKPTSLLFTWTESHCHSQDHQNFTATALSVLLSPTDSSPELSPYTQTLKNTGVSQDAVLGAPFHLSTFTLIQMVTMSTIWTCGLPNPYLQLTILPRAPISFITIPCVISPQVSNGDILLNTFKTEFLIPLPYKLAPPSPCHHPLSHSGRKPRITSRCFAFLH